MKRQSIPLIIQVVVVIFIITACTPTRNVPADPPAIITEPPVIEQDTSNVQEVVEPTPTIDPETPEMIAPTDEVEDTQEPPRNTPAWFDVPMVDVRTWQTFTINDHHGKVILVETLAMWCGRRRRFGL